MTPPPETEHVRWSEILTRRHATSLALVALGVWLHAADALIVATMLPAIIDEIGGGALVAWSVALYEVGSIVAGATGGFLASRLGLRAPMSTAAALFAAGCLISAVAPTMPALLAGRVLQGVGGGGLVALSFVAVSLCFRARVIARVLAVMSILWGVSSFLGPLMGALFVEFASWRWGFGFFALQAAALAIWIGLARGLGAPASGAAATGSIPTLRLALLAAGVISIAWAGIRISPFATPLLVAIGGVCLAVFLLLDGRSGSVRLLPQAPFSLRSIHGAALALVLCFSAATIGVTVYGPLLMTALHGAPVLVAGYIVALESVGWSIAAVLFSGAAERHDGRLIGAGALTICAGVAGLAYAMPAGPLWLIALFAFLQGWGFGMAWTFILRRATRYAPAGETERISAALPTVQTFGYALGAAVVGIVANASGFAAAEDPAEMIRPALWIFASAVPLAALGLVAAFRLTGNRETRVVAGPGPT